MLALLLLAAPAWATPSSADIELVSPMFGERSVPGADSAFAGYKNTLRVGTLLQYELDPLVYRQEGVEVGAAVANRFTTALGLAWDISPEFRAHAWLPVAGQWGGDSINAADGFGAGDADVGARLALLQGTSVGLAIAADLRLPTSKPDSWMGERGVRGVVGANLSLGLGRVDVLVGAGVQGRKAVDTLEDFELGTEVHGDAAVNVHIVPETLAVYLAAVGATGLSETSGPGNQPIEAMLGAQYTPSSPWQVNIGVGRGLSGGYGTSRFRALAGLTFTLEPKRPTLVVEPEPVAIVEPPEPEPEPPPPPPCTPAENPVEPPKSEWEEGQLAKLVRDRIVIREPIQFELGTADMKSVSRPVMAAVAQMFREHPEILEVVIEGHASNEGPFQANYDLSLSRAMAVYQLLVDAGIDAQRVSVRALGEVVPRGADPAGNRRVEFHITEQVILTAIPDPTYTPIPWSGEKTTP